ncbi:ABC transporter permease [Limoniibacter endophyticus]|uniref:ABC transporter permease n=1 Tax=Limoniibacter endophyticus TaxID=1565040 RepID=A0A8J3GI30_9HYPH|nr:ABC transporter permease [Limoniibacter endophyticus]GHC78914.1 ABC transporter permease [Limoniibacter endophyticus]
MTVWIARRIIQSIFILIAMTAIIFLAVNVIGDPVETLVNPEATQAERQRLIEFYGLDQPLPLQYVAFVKGVLQGDLGTSYVYGESAIKVILSRMPATLELATSTMVLSVLLGVPLGLYSGLRPNALGSRVIMGGSILGFSLPSFWTGLLLIMVFAVYLRWLPATGRGETIEIMGIGWSFLTRDGLSHLALPVATLSIYMSTFVMRLTRAGVEEVVPQEYVQFARAKGLRESRILRVHVLRNIMITLVTVIGLEFATLIAFTVVTETIFAWPGMGKLIIESIEKLDRPVIVAYLMIVVVLFVTVNLLVDILYTLLDPRIRIGGSV